MSVFPFLALALGVAQLKLFVPRVPPQIVLLRVTYILASFLKKILKLFALDSPLSYAQRKIRPMIRPYNKIFNVV